jgi:hypothetical protein
VSTDTLEERVARSMGFSRLLGGLTTALGVIALCLACLGLFGTMSYAMTRRTYGTRHPHRTRRRTWYGAAADYRARPLGWSRSGDW